MAVNLREYPIVVVVSENSTNLGAITVIVFIFDFFFLFIS